MKITINPFDKNSIAEAEKLVRQYKDEFEVKVTEFTRRLAEIGVHTATTMFAMADVDGMNDAVVSLEKKGSGYAVVASGATVGFIEFGTGVKWRKWTDAGNVDGSPYTPPPPGSYGKGQGKNTWGWWFYPNEGAEAQHTYGNPPAEAMLQARDNMVMYVTQIAREVFR